MRRSVLLVLLICVFDAAVAAFERHAALASHLRRNGWTLAARDAVA